ncbi:MAG TPA: electron transport complex subunit RsxG [Woeseiaceae bacterium]
MNEDAKKERSPSAWSSGIVLAVVAAVCTALVAMTYRLTAPRIADNEKTYLEQSLRPALANVFYDNDLLESTLVLPAPHGLPGNAPATIYRLFSEQQPVAAVFVVSARGGYAGPIRLLIAVEYSGKLTGVQVLEHNETPGIGDLIEPSRSNWLTQFEDVSLDEPPRDRWAIRRDGGAFDQLTGASITPRAIVRAVKETLLYYEANRDRVFQAPQDAATEHDEVRDQQ